MNNQQHPITPPPELVQQWIEEANHNEPMFAQVAVIGARWGADQELEACCEWFVSDWTDIETADMLRAYRRPKPQSLKEQALAIVCRGNQALTTQEQVTIRCALEQLDD